MTPYLYQLREMHARLNDDLDRLSRSQSEIDRKMSDVYHDLERCELDEAAGYAAAMILQQTLLDRRQVKHEFAHLRPINKELTAMINVLETNFKKQTRRDAEVLIRPSTNNIGGIQDDASNCYIPH